MKSQSHAPPEGDGRGRTPPAGGSPGKEPRRSRDGTDRTAGTSRPGTEAPQARERTPTAGGGPQPPAEGGARPQAGGAGPQARGPMVRQTNHPGQGRRRQAAGEPKGPGQRRSNNADRTGRPGTGPVGREAQPTGGRATAADPGTAGPGPPWAADRSTTPARRRQAPARRAEPWRADPATPKGGREKRSAPRA